MGWRGGAECAKHGKKFRHVQSNLCITDSTVPISFGCYGKIQKISFYSERMLNKSVIIERFDNSKLKLTSFMSKHIPIVEAFSITKESSFKLQKKQEFILMP